MEIPILIEPTFQHFFGCKQTLNGIYGESKRKKYTLRFADGNAYGNLDYDALFVGGPRLAIVVGTSVSSRQELAQRLICSLGGR